MNTEVKHRALHRLKILEGQLRGIQNMIEKDDYCIDILTQNLAIQKSLGSLNKLILENHLRTHVTQMLGTGDEVSQNKAVRELLNLYELSNIRSK